MNGREERRKRRVREIYVTQTGDSMKLKRKNEILFKIDISDGESKRYIHLIYKHVMVERSREMYLDCNNISVDSFF